MAHWGMDDPTDAMLALPLASAPATQLAPRIRAAGQVQ